MERDSWDLSGSSDSNREVWDLRSNRSSGRSSANESWDLRDQSIGGNGNSGISVTRRSRKKIIIPSVIGAIIIATVGVLFAFNFISPGGGISSGGYIASSSGSSYDTNNSGTGSKSSSSSSEGSRINEAANQIETVVSDSSLSNADKETKLFTIHQSFGEHIFTEAIRIVPVCDPSDNQWKSLDSMMKNMVREDGSIPESNPLYQDPLGSACYLLIGNGLEDPQFMGGLLGIDLGGNGYSENSYNGNSYLSEDYSNFLNNLSKNLSSYGEDANNYIEENWTDEAMKDAIQNWEEDINSFTEDATEQFDDAVDDWEQGIDDFTDSASDQYNDAVEGIGDSINDFFN